MNKKFIVAWIVLFVVWLLGDFLIHGVLLHADYRSCRTCTAPRPTRRDTSPSCCSRT